MNTILSALGYYEATGNPAEAQLAIGYSFGTSTGEDSFNRSLADFILLHAQDRLQPIPIVADRTLVNAFPEQDEQVEHVVEGPVTTGFRGIRHGVDTWGTLLAAQEFMRHENLTKALMIGHPCHIGRIVMQAQKLCIESIVPPRLPYSFDVSSDQWRTRSFFKWVATEVPGLLVLRAQKKL